jgi:hypothetical protein
VLSYTYAVLCATLCAVCYAMCCGALRYPMLYHAVPYTVLPSPMLCYAMPCCAARTVRPAIEKATVVVGSTVAPKTTQNTADISFTSAMHTNTLMP